ncbi:MAG: PEP-CTERM sorting domain-containing protein, partial [Verrucomicrobiota bacterium]
SPIYGIVLDLDFSNSTVNFSNPNQTLVVDYTNVATGAGAPMLDVRIEAITPYIPQSAATGNNQNGSVGDDLKLHIDSGASTLFRFSLFNAGTETLYDPGVDYSFDFVFYDLDGNVSNSRGADQIIFYSPLTYTVTANTTIAITQDSSSITFTGTAGAVNGNEGLTSFANANQENASVNIEFSNLSQFDFTYGAPNNGAQDGGRNLLADPRDLVVNGTPTQFVPEPTSYGLLLGLSAVVFVWRRRF